MQPLTIDEINSMLTEIAKDPDSGADRFRALKMLSSGNAATVTLPEPLDPKEVTERLTRMIQCAGPTIAQVAFKRAFPTKKKSITDTPKIYTDDLPPRLMEKVKTITSLKLLYKHFPESKRNGVPKGYPVGRGLFAQQAWIQRAAVKLILDRENAELRGPEQVKGITSEHLRPHQATDAIGPAPSESSEPKDPANPVAGG
jgi:hypothetical protein